MKIAYLVDGYKDPAVTRKLILRLASDPDNEIFVHIDAKVDPSPFMPGDMPVNVHFADKRHVVYWGGLSQVQLALDMLREARKYGCERHVTLHNGCWPLWSNRKLREFFSEDRERIPMVNVSTSPLKKNYMRSSCYHMFEGVDRSKGYLPKTILARMISVFNRTGLKYRRGWYRLPDGERMDIYYSSGHFCISDGARDHMLDLVDQDPGILKYFLHCYVPEELFFATMVRHYLKHEKGTEADVRDNTRPNALSTLSETTFFNYLPGHIAEYTDPEDVKMLRDTGRPFFRKVTDESLALIERLEETVEGDD